MNKKDLKRIERALRASKYNQHENYEMFVGLLSK